jgi:hypothetical protein
MADLPAKTGGCHSSGISLGDVLRLPSGIRHGDPAADVAHGAAICLFLFPFLLVAVIVLLRSLRRREI